MTVVEIITHKMTLKKVFNLAGLLNALLTDLKIFYNFVNFCSTKKQRYILFFLFGLFPKHGHRLTIIFDNKAYFFNPGSLNARLLKVA